MKYLLLCVVFFLFLSCGNKTSFPFEIQKGVSKELATHRKNKISKVKYHLSFHIPLNKEEDIDSKLLLELAIQDKSQPLILDFKSNRANPKLAIVNGKSTPIKYQKEHLVIPSKHLVVGNNKIEIDFIAGEMSLNRNENYLFSLLVPDRARTLFPCFDQPDIKANYTLRIQAPKNWQVLSGASLESRTEKDNFATFQFKETDTMSTYLFSFVAGEFSVEKSSLFNMQSTLYHQEKNPIKIEASVPEIFDIHRQSITFMEAYTAYNFPFQKLDFATIFTHPYGGMEHTGAIQYRQSSLFLDDNATTKQKLNRAKLIAHETSHMWFGNLVTMKWFDDVWLKEVFANFMADKIANPTFPEINHNLAFFVNHYPSAYSIDRSIGANPIGQNLDNLNNAGSLYGKIIYDKAPIMMRQLERIMGSDHFRKSLQQYIAKYANANANWNDLVTILDSNTNVNLKDWSKAWVYVPGRPIIKSKVRYNDKNQITSFMLEQVSEYQSESKNILPQIFDLTLVYKDSLQPIKVNFKKQKLELEALHGLKKPDAIIYNSNGLGYGVFPISDRELELVSSIEDKVTRAVIYLNSYENVLLGNITVKQALKVYQKGIKSEKNELILSMLCNQVNHLFWTYLPEKERQEMQGKITNTLFNRLQSKETPNIKKTLFDLFKSLGYTGVARDRLYDIWRKKLKYFNLNLNEDDFTELAMQLAIYDHKATSEILSKTETAMKDPNKLERFHFLAPALSKDPKVRKNFFKSFEEDKNREKESWVSLACYYIHHPLRQKDGIEYLYLSLKLLEEIQQTGDIFFPKNWLDNTIGMYCSPKAYDMVTKFLDQHPNLNPSLRLKILQTADDLYRINNTSSGK